MPALATYLAFLLQAQFQAQFLTQTLEEHDSGLGGIHFPVTASLNYHLTRKSQSGVSDRVETFQRLRVMPRWAEILVIALGSSAASIGGMLLIIDGNCPGGVMTNDPLCSHVYQTKTAGISALSVGGGLFGSGILMLLIDELKIRDRSRVRSNDR